MTVGDRIRIKREKLNISQKELADKIKTTKQTIYKYEMNIVTNIPSDKIEQIAKILETSPCYLMGWDRESNHLSLRTTGVKSPPPFNSDYRLEKIIDCFNGMNEQGKDFLAMQSEICYKQFSKSNEKESNA